MSRPRLLLSAVSGGTNVGDSLLRAAVGLGLEVRVEPVELAFHGPRLVRTACWRLLGRRPPSLNSYNSRLRSVIEEFSPNLFLVVGVHGVTMATLAAARRSGAVTANWATDDPWNPVHLSSWFLGSLPGYDRVFSPRRANLEEFWRAGVGGVYYLPFGYDPELLEQGRDGLPTDGPDVLYVGGGDRDRAAYLRPLLRTDLTVTLYGGYWANDRLARAVWGGVAGPAELNRATRAAKVSVCLVRRANRDEHVMRSYEIPAAGGCPLVEDTSDHRELYGETAEYFNSPDGLSAAARRLVADAPRRAHLAAAAHRRVTAGGNTYRDRLTSILNLTLLTAERCVP